jgi:hypothetical protein
MVRKGCTPEQIINNLREAEVLLNQGNTIGVICKKIGVCDYTSILNEAARGNF